MDKLVDDATYSRLVEAVKRYESIEEIMHIVSPFQSREWVEIEYKFYSEVAQDIQPGTARKLLWREQEFGILPNFDTIANLFILNDRSDLLELLLQEFKWGFNLQNVVYINSCIQWGAHQKLKEWIANKRFNVV